MIAGLQYIPDYLTPHKHDELLRAVDEHPWQRSVDHRVRVYGYNYRHKDRAAIPIGELPRWSIDLAHRLREEGLLSDVPNQLVVNDYAPGEGIFDHVDQTVFGDVVISVSLGSTCLMHFLRSDSRDDQHERKELLLQPRSLLALSGEARSAWQHGIAATLSDEWQGRQYKRHRRVSLTFRRI